MASSVSQGGRKNQDDESAVETCQTNATIRHPEDEEEDDLFWNQLVIETLQQQQQQDLPWQYMAEGGRHVVFAFDNTTEKNNNNHPTLSSRTTTAPNNASESNGTENSIKNHSLLEGYLLRFQRDDLVKAFAMNGAAPSPKHWNAAMAAESLADWAAADGGGEPPKDNNRPFRFIRDIVQARLAPYVDVPKVVRGLDPAGVARLYRHAVASGKIPSHRRALWETSTIHNQKSNADNGDAATTAHGSGSNELEATLLREYRYPISNHHHCDCNNNSRMKTSSPSSSCWSVELKPKAGYRAFSPLVHPRRRIKYTASRFQLMQQYKAETKRRKHNNHDKPMRPPTSAAEQDAVDTRNPAMSSISLTRYNPLQLFASGGSSRNEIRMALQDLVECPKNNLRLWKYLDHNDINDWNHAARIQLVNLPPVADSDDPAFVNPIFGIVALILQRESFLPKLLELQKLDWIDADGAILLYQHLLKLLPHLDPLAVQAKIDGEIRARNQVVSGVAEFLNHSLTNGDGKETSVQSYEAASVVDDYLRTCPIQPPSIVQNGAFCQLFLAIDSFRNQVDEKRRDESFLDAAYKDCTDLIKLLNVEETIYLLQAWLLSLAMCDISFFMSLEFHDEVQDNCGDSNSLSNHHPSFGAKLQTAKEPGWLRFDGSNNARVNDDPDDNAKTSLWVRYSIKIIDCDAKPAHKLASRHLKEEMYELLLQSTKS